MLGGGAHRMRNDAVILDELDYSQCTPERQLVAAVLAQAVHDVVHPSRWPCLGGGTARDSLQWRAVAWISSDDPAPFSFAWCCHTLDLHPEVVRKTLARRVRRKRAEAAGGHKPAAAGGRHA